MLIPGAFQGGWAWRPVAARLRAQGHRAVAVTLPGLGDGDDTAGLGLRDAVRHIVAVVNGLGVDGVSVVGHSWSAFPIAGAAPELRCRVREIVYLNAHIPLRDTAQVDDIPPAAATMVRELIDSSPTRSMAAPLEMVQQMFLQRAAEDTQRMLYELLTPQPGAYFLEGLDVPNVAELGINCRYLLGEDDQALFCPGTELAARIGLEPVMVPGPHQNLLTHPDDVAQAILHSAGR
ncbi:hypothetical protein A5647_08800 [Mycobacterium sp. 1100029.7]|nr:hypothetical protein A5647_08800 [Mycobacterium sp. 1100029.7]